MLNDNQRLDGHERFKELGALVNSGALSAGERLELERHLQVCEECREICAQYRLLSTVGMPWLASNCAHPEERGNWDDLEAREKLLARIHAAERCLAALRALFAAAMLLHAGLLLAPRVRFRLG